MLNNVFIVFVGVFFCGSSISSAELRTWTKNDGQEKSAEIQGVYRNKIALTLENGEAIEYSRSHLVKADLSYVDQWLAEQGKDAESSERVFTNARGSKKFAAKPIGLWKDRLMILIDGSPERLHIIKLSEADQQWIAEWDENRKKKTLVAVDYHALRKWESIAGTSILAKMAAITDESVILKKVEGKEVIVRLSQLSDLDLIFLKTALKAEGRRDHPLLTKVTDGSSEKELADRASPAMPENPKVSDAPEVDESLPKTDIVENFDAAWPKLVSIDIDVEIKVVEEDEKNMEFIYHSPHYEFISDVGLSQNVVRKFAVLFETTREYCKQLPISTSMAHREGGAERHKILLFETVESYVYNGGPPDSAGVYIPSKRVIMAPLTSVGVKKVGSSFMFDYKGSNKTLPHEITHQLTDKEYYSMGSRGWFTEGLAEYVAVTPYRSGNYMVRSNLSAIKAYTTEYGKRGCGGRALSDEFSVIPLKDFFTQSYGSFTANGNFNYGVGLLLTYYFFHMEEDRESITNFLKAQKEGKEGDELIKVLLNGRTFSQLEEQISKAWKKRGIKMTFQY